MVVVTVSVEAVYDCFGNALAVVVLAVRIIVLFLMLSVFGACGVVHCCYLLLMVVSFWVVRVVIVNVVLIIN